MSTQNAQSTYRTLPLPQPTADTAESLRALVLYLQRELLRIQEALRPGTTRAVTGNTTADVTDSTIYVDTTGGAASVQLPDPGSVGQKRLTIKNITGGGAVSVLGTVDGTSNPAIAPAANNSTTIESDGTNWHIVSNNF